jgi:hypothetical protein
MDDKTGAGSAHGAESKPATRQSEAEEPRRNIGRHATRFLAGAALLSTTALLPIIEPKTPPYKSD